MKSRKTFEKLSPEEALRQTLTIVVDAGRTAHDLRHLFLPGSRTSERIGSIDDTIQACVASQLLMTFEGASFYTPEAKTLLVHGFSSSGTFTWMLNSVDGAFYRDGSKRYDVRLVLCDGSTDKLLGAIVVRPEQNEALIAREKTVSRVNTDPVTGTFERRDLLKLGSFGSSTARIVLIPERFKAQARILEEAGLKVVFETSETHSPMDLFDGRICGALSVDAPVYGTGANGFLARHASGYWDHAPYVHETRTFPWSIAAADERTKVLLRAVVSAYDASATP